MLRNPAYDDAGHGQQNRKQQLQSHVRSSGKPKSSRFDGMYSGSTSSTE
jgi:hypothetical protein